MIDKPRYDEIGTADWVFDDDATPVCSHCFEMVCPLDHYCEHCGEAVGQWTAYIPWVRIPYYARFFERLWMRVWWRRGVPLFHRIVTLLLISLVDFFALVMLVGIPFVLWRKWRGGGPPDCGFTWRGGYR